MIEWTSLGWLHGQTSRFSEVGNQSSNHLSAAPLQEEAAAKEDEVTNSFIY